MKREMSSSEQWNKVLAALVAAMVALTLCAPASAFAAPYQAASTEAANTGVLQEQVLTICAKSKSVKSQTFSTSTATIKKKATKVGKGTTKLNMKGGKGYIKFTATKSKTYSFTFSNLSGKSTIYSAFVEAQLQDSRNPKYSFMTKVATKGGKNTTLWLAQKGYESKSGKTVYRNLASRTGKIKLAKGQDIYFYFSSLVKNTAVTLKVK